MTPSSRLPRKRRGRYHHGDLRQALLTATLRRIQEDGADALTLRAVGQDLGVSRTALYRHFTDKAALLAAVATDGFRRFRTTLVEAWDTAGKGPAGFLAMGEAYVRFACDNAPHYRVMFGGALQPGHTPDCDLAIAGQAAFDVLVTALAELQREGRVRAEDLSLQAFFVWSTVHGIAMLSIDGRLPHGSVDPVALVRFGLARVMEGIGSSPTPTVL